MARWPAASMHDPARLADGERRARVGAEVEVLDRDRVGPVARPSARPRARGSCARRAPGVLPGGGLDHAAVERDQPPAVVRDDAVAGVGDAGVDAEDDHVHARDSARRPGRLPVRASGARQRGAREAEEPDAEEHQREADRDDHHPVEHPAAARGGRARRASSASTARCGGSPPPRRGQPAVRAVERSRAACRRSPSRPAGRAGRAGTGRGSGFEESASCDAR